MSGVEIAAIVITVFWGAITLDNWQTSRRVDWADLWVFACLLVLSACVIVGYFWGKS